MLDDALLGLLREDLEAASANLRPGYLVNPSDTVKGLAGRGRTAKAKGPRAIVEGIQHDLREFAARHDLSTVVVVNVSSTEPPREVPIEWATLERFERYLDGRTSKGLTNSVLSAYAALDAGFPYVNFTPSPGSTIPAIVELGKARNVPHMGSDGKTGETLVKTVLAPLFTGRALKVLSWEGYNMLGNRDGLVLDDPQAKLSKTRSKDVALRSILKDADLHSRVTIDYVPSLDDWKVAWDYVHFEGFLGARMSMQFTWQGNDSALAAPLVLDLARLMAHAHARGEGGLQPHLAAYLQEPGGRRRARLRQAVRAARGLRRPLPRRRAAVAPGRRRGSPRRPAPRRTPVPSPDRPHERRRPRLSAAGRVLHAASRHARDAGPRARAPVARVRARALPRGDRTDALRSRARRLVALARLRLRAGDRDLRRRGGRAPGAGTGGPTSGPIPGRLAAVAAALLLGVLIGTQIRPSDVELSCERGEAIRRAVRAWRDAHDGRWPADALRGVAERLRRRAWARFAPPPFVYDATKRSLRFPLGADLELGLDLASDTSAWARVQR